MTIQWLDKILQEAIDGNFTGNLQINFFKGSVSNVNKTESLIAPLMKKEIQFNKKAETALAKNGY